MKRLITILSLVTVMFFGTSCSKKSNVSPVTKATIVGKWTEDSLIVNEYQNAVITYTEKASTFYGKYYQFNSNGTGVYYLPASPTTYALSVPITYTFVNSILTLKIPAFQYEGYSYRAISYESAVLTLNDHELAIRYGDNGPIISINDNVQYLYFSR